MPGQEDHLRSDEDVEAILRLAVQQTGGTTADLRQRLVQSASELGISSEALAEAERVYLEQRTAELARAAEAADFSEFRRTEWMSFVHHLIPYVIVNAFLIGMNLVSTGHLSWSKGPLLGWGIGLAFHFFFTLFPGDQEKAFRKWQAKKRKRSQAERLR